MTQFNFPHKSLFQKYVCDLGEPDENGWATGTCPFCGDSGTFRVNLKFGGWVCLPAPTSKPSGFERVGEILPDVIRDIDSAYRKHRDMEHDTTT